MDSGLMDSSANSVTSKVEVTGEECMYNAYNKELAFLCKGFTRAY